MNKEFLEKTMNSTKLTMSEKMETIKEEMKILLRDNSYLDLFNKYKVSKLSKKSKDLYHELYDLALEELLEEKKKDLSFEELTKIQDYFKKETEKTREFISKTEKELLSKKDIDEKSKELSLEDFNYKRLAVAAKEGTLSEEQRVVFENEKKKVDLLDAKSDLEIISKYQDSISKAKKNKNI